MKTKTSLAIKLILSFVLLVPIIPVVQPAVRAQSPESTGMVETQEISSSLLQTVLRM
jgi:hypothetical protein